MNSVFAQICASGSGRLCACRTGEDAGDMLSALFAGVVALSASGLAGLSFRAAAEAGADGRAPACAVGRVHCEDPSRVRAGKRRRGRLRRLRRSGAHPFDDEGGALRRRDPARTRRSPAPSPRGSCARSTRRRVPNARRVAAPVAAKLTAYDPAAPMRSPGAGRRPGSSTTPARSRRLLGAPAEFLGRGARAADRAASLLPAASRFPTRATRCSSPRGG